MSFISKCYLYFKEVQRLNESSDFMKVEVRFPPVDWGMMLDNDLLVTMKSITWRDK